MHCIWLEILLKSGYLNHYFSLIINKIDAKKFYNKLKQIVFRPRLPIRNENQYNHDEIPQKD